MKSLVLLPFIYLVNLICFAQTKDFTINLIYELNIFKQLNLCSHYAEYANLKLISRSDEECIYKCNLMNIKKNADSIIFINRIRYHGYWGELRVLELKQYFRNKNVALKEFDSYYKQLDREFDLDSNMFSSKCLKRKNDTTALIILHYKEAHILPKSIICYSGNVFSKFIKFSIWVGLIKDDEKYQILTEIYD